MTYCLHKSEPRREPCAAVFANQHLDQVQAPSSERRTRVRLTQLLQLCYHTPRNDGLRRCSEESREGIRKSSEPLSEIVVHERAIAENFEGLPESKAGFVEAHVTSKLFLLLDPHGIGSEIKKPRAITH